MRQVGSELYKQNTKQAENILKKDLFDYFDLINNNLDLFNNQNKHIKSFLELYALQQYETRRYYGYSRKDIEFY